MTTAHLPRLLLAATFLASLTVACESGEKKAGLPPAKAAGATATSIPGPPPKPETGPGVAQPGAAQVSNTASRYVATALPSHSAELGPKMSGTLAAVTVAEGEHVKKGQTPLPRRLSWHHAPASRPGERPPSQGATLNRDDAQRELDRQQQLVAKGTVGAAVLERAQANYDASRQRRRASAEVMLSASARRLTNDSSVASPIDGVVAAQAQERRRDRHHDAPHHRAADPGPLA
jgi:multidrug efflux pump subunit AcrA (membrane-fusion protein)